MSDKSDLEQAFLFGFRSLSQKHGLPEPEREYRFYTGRQWRLDFAWPEYMVAVEVDGGIWVKGAHSRGTGITNDARKRNRAALVGWTVLIFPTSFLDPLDPPEFDILIDTMRARKPKDIDESN